jgi:CBS domain-containing protein/anti-sigma regulatory factor (Ser/Thr protein kinase)
VAQIKEFTRVQELIYELKVEDVMTNNVVVVSPENTMNELREILRSKRISGAPVVEGDKLLGIISIEDLIECLASGKMDSSLEEKMSKNVETLYPDEPLIHAVNKLEQHGFGRLPVVERDQGKLTGILTKSSVITGLLRKLETEYQEEEFARYPASHIFKDVTADKTSFYFQYNITGQDFNRAGESASRIRKTLLRLGLQPQLVRRSAIIAYEAEMNIVIYTKGGQISTQVEPSSIKIKAIDTGSGIPNIKKAMQPGFSTAPEWVQELGFGAGMGLPNIKKSADKMTLKSQVGQGTNIEAILYIKDSEK